MKRFLVLSVSLVYIACTLVAQLETKAYEDLVEKFAVYLNTDQSDAIFNLFSAEMQNALPLDKAKEFFAKFKPLGKITTTKFIKFESNQALYKLQFELGVVTLFLSHDKDSKIDGFMIKPYIPENLPTPARNVTKLVLPFGKEWFVVWGGDTKELNYHVVNQAQKNAFDFVILDAAGKSFENAGEQNEDYYCFGKEIFASCDGDIVYTADGLPDNKPKVKDAIRPFGNMVICQTVNNEFLFFCHFKQHSIAVKPGQKVKQGQLLGLCGNSGLSSEAHLHFHIQNTKEINIATGIKCHFDQIIVNGEKKIDYSPIKNERIKNLTYLLENAPEGRAHSEEQRGGVVNQR